MSYDMKKVKLVTVQQTYQQVRERGVGAMVQRRGRGGGREKEREGRVSRKGEGLKFTNCMWQHQGWACKG